MTKLYTPLYDLRAPIQPSENNLVFPSVPFVWSELSRQIINKNELIRGRKTLICLIFFFQSFVSQNYLKHIISICSAIKKYRNKSLSEIFIGEGVA